MRIYSRYTGTYGVIQKDRPVHLAELLDSVRTKGDKARPPGAGLYPLHPVIGGGVTPQQIHEYHTSVLHGNGPLQGVYLLYLSYRPSNACIQYRKKHGTVV